MHIYIDNELIDKLGNNIKFDTSSENEIMKKIFSKFNPKIRGKMIENIIANKVMNDYIQIGDGLGGHFPVIDLANGKNVVSIKSMNIFGKSCYATDAAGNYIMNGKYHVYDEEKMFQRVKKYYDQIDDIEIKINNHTVKKQLHLEINKGSSVEKYKRVINNKVQNYIKEKNKQKKSAGKCPKLSAFFTIN